MRTRTSLFYGCSFAAIAAFTGLNPPVAKADVDCKLIAPPGVSVTEAGDLQAKAAADAILKSVKGGVEVKVSAKKSLETAQLNAPKDDPQALKSRTLYIFCGMVANAPDISTERKYEMLKELDQVPPPPSPPPPPLPPKADVPSKFGLPALGTSKQAAAKFAATHNGSWGKTVDNVDYVTFNSELFSKPATVHLFFNGDAKLYVVRWTVSGKRNLTERNGDASRTRDGPEPTSVCGSFVDKLVNYFVTKADVSPGAVTETRPDISDPWRFIPGGSPWYCKHNPCWASVDVTEQRAALTKETQSVKIFASALTASAGTQSSSRRDRYEISECKLTTTVRGDA